MKKLTVADILQLDILKNVTICAGAAGLSHFVTGITTAEDPDLIQWLRSVYKELHADHETGAADNK
ncbi:putative uncharacterized protein [Enterocloster bolteae CAG:59]|nr:putative uncharacterized protein [Enterocloster bolteae CAG:59]